MAARAVGRGVIRPPRASKTRRIGLVGESALAGVVGQETYASWVGMLRVLVPHGRTHRLAVVLAGMLQYAVTVAASQRRHRAARDSAAAALLRAVEELDPQSANEELRTLVDQLFRDARVSPDRVSARGQAYCITDSAIEEFIRWEDMPWE